MHLVYFDEVKSQPDQPTYWLGGLVIDEKLVGELEAQVNDLSEEYLGSRRLESSTEFHAKDILAGKGNFKKRPIDERLSVLKKLFTIIDRHDEICKVEVCVHCDRMIAGGPELKAFMFLVERVQMQLRSLNSIGMLIGDHEKSITNAATYNLSRYRQQGTDYQYGLTIDRLIDTVHFSHSHHSRLLQLADLYVYAQQLSAIGDLDKYPRREIIKFLRSETRLLHPHRYKHWPTENSWYA